MKAQEPPFNRHRDDIEHFVGACPSDRSKQELNEIGRDGNRESDDGPAPRQERDSLFEDHITPRHSKFLASSVSPCPL